MSSQPGTMTVEFAAPADHQPTLETSVVSVTPAYRRNGKLFSCEPCRKGKLKCDHNSPTCGRCARRGRQNECIYHPAPLTKPRISPSIGPQRTRPSPRASTEDPYPTSRVDRPRASGLVSPPLSTSTIPLGQVSGPTDSRPIVHKSSASSPAAPMSYTPFEGSKQSSTASVQSPESAMSFRDSRIGFLGATSYSAVYAENQNILQTPDVEETPDDLPRIGLEKIEQGARVLSMLKDLPVYRKFTERWFELSDGIIVMQPVFKIWIDELWSEFGHLLADGQPEQLLSLSESIWRNTRQPMRVHGNMTAKEWAKSASGKQLRWEVVGVILSMVGLIAVNLSNYDGIFDSIRESYVDRATFAERMRRASEFCLCFCYESEVLNDIYVCFMYEDLILVECLKGDAHYAAWQRTGELLDAIVAMGLHQGNKEGPEMPFFLAQLRKKIFASAYGHDKVMATFMGRPPRLSHKYCKMEPPLDLSDDEVFSEGDELQCALSKLDENGWNTSGHLHRNTWQRIWFQNCRTREDILEIALGSSEDEEDIAYKAEKVKTQMERLQGSFPDFMNITPEQVFEDRLGPGISFGTSKKTAKMHVNALLVIAIHTGFVHTEFLLERAMVNRLRKDTKKLIPVARRMLKLVLLAQLKKDVFRDFQGDLIYMLAFNGLPAAGVLAVELLTQGRTGQYTADILPRSETVQDLSVFISALAAVGPGEGNFSICSQGRKTLTRVLDQILSPNPPIPMETSQGEAISYDDTPFAFPIGSDVEFLQWLEHVEWDKNTWIEPQGGEVPAGNSAAVLPSTAPPPL